MSLIKMTRDKNAFNEWFPIKQMTHTISLSISITLFIYPIHSTATILLFYSFNKYLFIKKIIQKNTYDNILNEMCKKEITFSVFKINTMKHKIFILEKFNCFSRKQIVGNFHFIFFLFSNLFLLNHFSV